MATKDSLITGLGIGVTFGLISWLMAYLFLKYLLPSILKSMITLPPSVQQNLRASIRR